MTIPRNLSVLAGFAGASNTPTMNLPNIGEVITVSATQATGIINYDCITQSQIYYTATAIANWTVNFRGNATTSLNSFMSVGQSVTVAFFVTNSSTPYYNTAVTVDGASVTPKWQGGSAPSAGNASAIDVYVYNIIKTGNAAFTIFASQTIFSA